MNSMIAAPVMTLGTDPELFVAHRGRIIGAEKAIPNGLAARSRFGLNMKAVVLDGVQAELNPFAQGYVENLRDELTATFRTLRDHLSTLNEVQAVFTSTVPVTQEELDSLSAASRISGCKPSKNIYGLIPEKADFATYHNRSAGGHIHMGVGSPIFNPKIGLDERYRLVALMDVLAGNTAVLIDRDPNAPERRLYYGLPGEYREPKHGLEYRTLSNFWLRNYALMDLMFGFARMATGILTTTLNGGPNLEAALLGDINFDTLIPAIRTNDSQLARENFKVVGEFIGKWVSDSDDFPLTPRLLGRFDEFLRGIEMKGLDAWFPTDVLGHWCADDKVGWKDFLTRI